MKKSLSLTQVIYGHIRTYILILGSFILISPWSFSFIALIVLAWQFAVN